MMTATKVRLSFAKRGDLRLVSHHDLLRCLERTLRRAQIPMAVSQGFNPRPKIVFALALALGIEGRREVVELELAEPLEPAELLERLRKVSPPGLDWVDVKAVAPGRSAPRVEAAQYFLEVPVDRQEATRSQLAALLASTQWPYTRHREGRDVAIDVRPFVLGAEFDPLGGPTQSVGVLRFRMKITPNGSARPEEVIDALGLSDLLGQGTVLVRTEVELVP
jgi:radical SAM-linked protein